jgi:uncharacterized protein (DUF2267 family)
MAKATVFDTSLRDAHQWLETVNKELGILGEKTGRAALRATLHAVRDSLTMREAVQLGDCLPVLIRGLYYDGWNPKEHGKRVAKSEDFMAIVRHDVRGHEELSATEAMLRATFGALERLLPQSEAAVVLNALPAEVQQLWPHA